MRPLLLLFVTAVVGENQPSPMYSKVGCRPLHGILHTVCLKVEPYYGYDPAKGECVEFVYGGCEGNENNFQTKESCEKACIEGTTEQIVVDSTSHPIYETTTKQYTIKKGSSDRPALYVIDVVGKLMELEGFFTTKIGSEEVLKAFSSAKTKQGRENLKEALKNEVTKAIDNAIAGKKSAGVKKRKWNKNRRFGKRGLCEYLSNRG
ncbi:unnamed protein product [Strongylus vulgaris]|uniref:BPTI/Kunitz inhibitor domain-containing protein n=1 Tax=Strongylus vulgaris TaxID=40348 RepID=A0A3P7JAS6_STRVU|nr:unnamed protein product [Strongylus vulgaris]